MNADITPEGELSPTKRALLAVQDLRAQLKAAHQEAARANQPVAIVGMGCRYPGIESLDEFWRVISEGIDTVSEVPADRWNAAAFSMTNKGGFLKHIDEFDAAFFGISPREAPHVDPRQRVAMEVAWEALEHAGIAPDSLAGSPTGVFLATLTNDYDHLLFSDLERVEIYSGAGTANSIVANRISYFLDLRGPSLALDTACSGSLVAIYLACESLRKGECTLALAGGVNLNLMPKSSVFFHSAGALATDGHCKTFDAAADGIVRSDGAGMIVLKLLPDAVEAGDPIIAVIRGCAINHDGRSNGIMAPNGVAQRALLAEAYRRAGVAPSSVQMIEAHGTGTKLGDPIEVASLADVLLRDRPKGQVCSLGSFKTNVGHTEAAAGVGGVIKAALALHHRLIPPTLHFKNPNPLIPFEGFEVPTTLRAWPNETQPLIAGVSGFGFGGTNAHLVLEEAPARKQPEGEDLQSYLLPLSARTPEALESLAASYRVALNGNVNVSDICYTAAARRMHHPLRLAVTGDSAEALIDALESVQPEIVEQKGPLAFVFSGQGSHWPSMGRALYEKYDVFRSAIDECHRLIGRDVVTSALDATTLTQPAIFAVQVALGALWRSWGITPDYVVGHSLGEVAAAHFAGALSLEDAVRVVLHRSRLMQTMEGKGKTAVVGLSWEQTREAISPFPDLSIAGSNSPLSTVISGTAASLNEVMRQWESRKIFCRLVQGVEIAFHSPQMDGIAAELEQALEGIKPRKASIPLLSTVTGKPIEGEQLDASYWARNLRQPFLFTQATRQLLDAGCSVVVEVSPNPVLTSAMQQTARQGGLVILNSLKRGIADVTSMFGTLGKLYQLGFDVAWRNVYSSGQCVSLPTYPWQRQRYWLDQLGGSSSTASKQGGAHPLLGERTDPAFDSNVHIWEIDLDAQHPRYLADHRVLGQVVVPASVWAEMAIAAARDLFKSDAVVLRDLKLDSALKLSEQKRVQVVLTSKGEVSLYSRSNNGAWTRNASGTCAVADRESPSTDLNDIRLRTPKLINPESHYATMLASGLEYGPAFQVHRRIQSGDGEALAELQLPDSVSANGFICHPALLDGALRTAIRYRRCGRAQRPVQQRGMADKSVR